ncbi:hypothetical protein [Rhodococcus sp. IEGM 1374]|uniref:hypothetical protein n=1 Tax=Rhodococcus sp. IEGM 1374 TaxID=3082221 RepID=UPI0029559DF1|nr:hypothetical protein [Rhodococcus sp. IEGM 1374]MDV7992101.1 hypothetical protein [Rhodococcus sp. IEGM 1374]
MSERVPVNFREAVIRESGNYVHDSARVRQFLLLANRALKNAGHDIELVEVFEVDHED